MTNGKGPQRRPPTVSPAEFERRWHLAFQKLTEKDLREMYRLRKKRKRGKK